MDPGSKRDKVYIACTNCRKAKYKCSGDLPCRRCDKKELECTYPVKITLAKVLEEVVSEYERLTGISRDSMKEQLENTNSTSMTPTSSINISNETKKRKRDEDDVDGMATGTTRSPGLYFGASSATSFVKQLISTDQYAGNNFMDYSDEGNAYRMTRSESHYKLDLQDILLPSRSDADRYVSNYFNYAYTLYPFIHQPTFMRIYKLIWDGETVDELYYSILNLVFAFGCQLAPNRSKEDNFEVYLERLQKYLKFNLMENGSFLLVQALLLTGQFLQATAGVAGCWNIVGLTIRIAQGLGLHLDQKEVSSHIDAEMRKRIWQGCLIMDRIVSVTMGRPLMVHEASFTNLPVCVDDEYIDDFAIRPMLQPSKLDFFQQTIKLYNILGDILKTLYSDQMKDVPLIPTISGFDERLVKFKSQLPPHLELDLENGKQMPFQRQSIVLHLRFIHTNLLLLRPTLTIDRASTLVAGFQKIAALQLLNHVKELITIVYKYKDHSSVYLPAYWYNVYYVYTANTMILAAKVQNWLQQDINWQELEEIWNKGIEILELYKDQSKSVALCIDELQKMEKAVSQMNSNPTNELDNSDNALRDDILYSLLYDTLGPFGGPFRYFDDYNNIIQ